MDRYLDQALHGPTWLSNPVEAKLVKSWQDWPYTYVHPEIRKNIVP